MNASAVVCGPKFRFGKGAAGGVDELLAMGKKYGFECENIDYRCGKITLKTNNKKNKRC